MKKTFRMSRKESGFTLIELLVVILIIGILAAIAVPVFLNQRKTAQEVSLKSDLKNAGTILGGEAKFIGALPPNFVSSKGVQLQALRKSDRNNKIESSQFTDGQSPGWHSFLSNGASGAAKVITDGKDGYQGMNYRRLTTNNSVGTSGQFVGFNLTEVAQKGEDYRVGVAMRRNYAGCRGINIEFKDDKGNFSGGIDNTPSCFQKYEWKYFEAPGNINGNNVSRIVMSLYANAVEAGSTFDVTAAVMVQGANINSEAALDTNGNDYCIQGFHESNPTNIWSYSNLDGGIRNEKC